ncbi:MAG: IS1595 family transposase, partial [Bacteroidia bacterium]|nr:IS1595 family transposase [Bacteroidia bacterium]
TIFEASKMPLPKWFQLISLMLSAPKGISSMQLHRTLGITYKSAWYSAMRVRCAMIDTEVNLLEGIVEMVETYLGGKPRKRNLKKGTSDSNAILSQVETNPDKIKRGRGTKKVPVVGIEEREGKKRVRLEVMDKLTSKNLLAMLKRYVNTEKAIAMTDEYPAYAKFEEELQHLVIKHSSKHYVDGQIHTNTIEGFWSIIKNGLRGQFHVLSKKYLPFYLAEWSYKYNNRFNRDGMFNDTIDSVVTEEKPMLDYKPTKPVSEITTGDAFRQAVEREEKPKRRKLTGGNSKSKSGKAKRKSNKRKGTATKNVVRGKAKSKTVRRKAITRKPGKRKLVAKIKRLPQKQTDLKRAANKKPTAVSARKKLKTVNGKRKR